MDNSLHCKVSFRNELRRFPMNGVGFSELQKIIQSLFGIEKEFSLQYRDNENDLVILSSNEELACAISCISGNILQIVVMDPTTAPTMDMDQKSTPPLDHPWGCRFHPHHVPPHHFPPHHSPHQFHRHCHFGKDQSDRRNHRIGLRREIMSRKLKEIDSAIMEMSGLEETLPPLQQKKLFYLQKKKRCIEKHLSKMEEWNTGKKSEKCTKKHAKHEKKFMKKIEKHGKFLMPSPISPESTNSELMTLHAKLQSLKPELEEIKIQLKASKAALKEAQERGESTDQWLHEISQLKLAKEGKKQQMVPLGQQLREAQRVY